MGEAETLPEIIIRPDATDQQRQSLNDFEQLARNTEPGLIEAALQLQAQAPNLIPLMERVTRDGLKRVYSMWQKILATNAFSAVQQFDETTEQILETDKEHAKLLAQKNAAVAQRSAGRALVRVGHASGLDEARRQEDESLREALMRRKFIVFAGRVALITEEDTTPAPNGGDHLSGTGTDG